MLRKFLVKLAFFLFFSALNISGVYLFHFSTQTLLFCNLIMGFIIFISLLIFCKKCVCKSETQINSGNKEVEILKADISQYQTVLADTFSFLQKTDGLIRLLFGKKPLEIKSFKPEKISASKAKTQFETILNSFLTKELEELCSRIEHFSLLLEIYHKIPYLVQLLQNVISKTEDSAMNLIEKFDLIATETRKSSSEAEKTSKSLQKGEHGKGFSDIIAETKTAITQDNQLIGELVNLNQNNREKLGQIMELIEKINHGLVDVIHLSDKNKTISFNLSIEAVKLGEKGKGVMMIVREIQKFNQMANDITKGITGYMKTFRGYNEVLMRDWISKTEEIIKNIKNTNEKSEEVIFTLLNSYEATGNLFIRLSESTGNVNKSMSKIMESLQFQDITRQQIENISKFLGEMKQSIEGSKELFNLLGMDFEKDSQSIREKIKENWKKHVTVFDERKILE